MSAQLESSLRGLAAELKRSEGGFTSWLTGSLSTQHADVKSALDDALAKLRCASKDVDADDVRSSVRWRAASGVLSSRVPHRISHALSCLPARRGSLGCVRWVSPRCSSWWPWTRSRPPARAR